MVIKSCYEEEAEKDDTRVKLLLNLISEQDGRSSTFTETCIKFVNAAYFWLKSWLRKKQWWKV